MLEPAEIENNLPLTEVSYFILLSLAPGPQHGYAIMKEVRLLSQGRVSLSTGTLYGALKRMLEQGWIVRADELETSEPAVQDGRERKFYRLTGSGRHLLQAEVQRLEGLVAAAHLRASGEAG